MGGTEWEIALDIDINRALLKTQFFKLSKVKKNLRKSKF